MTVHADARAPRYLTAERACGRWRVELHAVAYDFELSARRAEAAGPNLGARPADRPRHA
jgi:hypothetical protein